MTSDTAAGALPETSVTAERVSFRRISMAILVLKTLVLAVIVYQLWPEWMHSGMHLDPHFWWFVGAGFVAQMVDGALGMAYGVSCNTLLLSFGVPPAVASAGVHTAEVFTTGVSGLAHLRMRNVDKALFFKLVLTGTIGAALGAWILADQINGAMIKPWVAIYLFAMGVIILVKSFGKLKARREHRHFASVLGFAGGFLDSIGGGGWGPVVTSNIILKGKSPAATIGTVNTAEFFVTFVSTGVFIYFIGVQAWQIVAALILGGVVAAPLAAKMVARIQPVLLMRMVGIVIMLTSAWTLYRALFS